jgi:K+ transporter
MVWTVNGWECLLVVSLFQFAMILMVSVKFDLLLVHLQELTKGLLLLLTVLEEKRVDAKHPKRPDTSE